jgi:hypothetical protein
MIRLAAVWVAAMGFATCGASLLACADDDEAARASERTRSIMHGIFEEIATLLPLSVQKEELADPARREQIEKSLAALSHNAELLQDHTARQDAQMRFIARSISGDTHEMERAFQEARYDRTSFLLQRITENCVVCHSRLPSVQDSPIAQNFVDESVFDGLEPEPRVALQIATRRFAAALVTLEQLLASPSSPVMMIGPLTDYLVISLRVKGNYKAPIPTLERFAKRRDLWTQLRVDVETWVRVLPELEKRASGPPNLATARALLTEGRSMVDTPAQRAWLAHFVTASSILHRYVDEQRVPGPELAEAYYLLGITEARIGRNYWVTSAPFLLETSIRMASDQPFAKDAFALLEQELIMSYEGVDADELPEEDLAHLAELRALVEGRPR